jgi:hypothetical protein
MRAARTTRTTCTTRTATLAVALLLSGAPACGDGAPTRPQMRDLAAAEARWAATRPAGDRYTMRQRRLCFCPAVEPHTVRVEGGRIVSVVNDATGEILDADRRGWYRTVPELFDEVRRAIGQRGVLRAVSYHDTMGYPTRLSLDPLPDAIDDEIVWETSAVAPIPP